MSTAETSAGTVPPADAQPPQVPPPQVAPPDADQWEIHQLDLDAYLRRISYRGSLDPDERTLAALHRAHVAAIPFENLDVVLGRGIQVNLEHVQAKLVRRGRGGYCFEHGTLFGAVLERLGYQVERWLARVGEDTQPRPRAHLILGVRVGDARWLADVGFGAGLLEPLPLAVGGPHRQGGWTFALARPDGETWYLRERQGADWATAYTFTEEPQCAVDIEVANHYTATHPHSPFVRQVVAINRDEATTRRLIGRQFASAVPDQSSQERPLVDTELGHTLRHTFGLALPADEVAALTTTLPPPEAATAGT